MCWQLSQRNELTDAITKILEEQGIEFLALAPAELKAVPGVDVPAVLSLIHAGITFLILRSKTAESFGGIDLQSEEGWKRVENGIQVLVKAFIAYCRSQKETDQ